MISLCTLSVSDSDFWVETHTVLKSHMNHFLFSNYELLEELSFSSYKSSKISTMLKWPLCYWKSKDSDSLDTARASEQVIWLCFAHGLCLSSRSEEQGSVRVPSGLLIPIAFTVALSPTGMLLPCSPFLSSLLAFPISSLGLRPSFQWMLFWLGRFWVHVLLEVLLFL